MTDTIERPGATITAADLRGLLDDRSGVRLLDVRAPGEFDAGHIPGAVNIPLDRIRGVAPTLARSQGGPLVVICQAGGRAATAAQTLTEAGGSGTVLEGGMNAWNTGGGQTDAGTSTRWALERQVRLVAGSLVLGGILAGLRWPPARFLSGAVGGGLVFAAASNTCAMGTALGKLPYNRGRSADVDAAVTDLIG